MHVRINQKMYKNIAEIQRVDEGVRLVNYGHEVVATAYETDHIEVFINGDDKSTTVHKDKKVHKG